MKVFQKCANHHMSTNLYLQPTHPSGETKEIVGIGAINHGHSCGEHACGIALQEHSVLRL